MGRRAKENIDPNVGQKLLLNETEAAWMLNCSVGTLRKVVPVRKRLGERLSLFERDALVAAVKALPDTTAENGTPIPTR